MEDPTLLKTTTCKLICAIALMTFLFGCTIKTPGGGLSNPNITIYPPSGTETSTKTITPTERITQTVTREATESPLLDEGAIDTLETLGNTLVSVRDFVQIAQKYLGIQDLALQSDEPPTIYNVGDREQFIIMNDDTEEHSTVTAILEYATPHLYFWIQEGVSFAESDLRNLANEFENVIYPTNRAYFGSEWTPGIDNDVHVYVLYTYGLGTYVGGYFSSEDEHAPSIDEFSNAHEMMYIAADGVSLSYTFAYEVLAHEFAHMINYYQDRNEDTWLSEGTAELAGYINGYSDNWAAASYLGYHDISITDWPADMADADPYYSGAFLFTTYLSERFGQDVTQKIVNSQENGLRSLDAVFQEFSMQDDLTGGLLNADRVFADWQVANFIDDASLEDGRYGYNGFDLPFTADVTEYVSECPLSTQDRAVNQYGVDYIEIDCSGTFTINFQGDSLIPISEVDPFSGDHFFWSNRSNEASMTLTQEFDLTGVSGEIEFSYWTWYDMEEEFDYVYLLAKPENGDWAVLQTPSCIAGKNSYACGYTGSSGDWIQETVDISQYAGQRVTLQFEYLTDLGITNVGFFMDDTSIPAIDHFTNFDSDDGGWIADGFARIENKVPQTFGLTLIVFDGNRNIVSVIELPQSQEISIPVTLEVGQYAVLAVSGTAKYSLLPANYTYSITQ